MPPEIINNDPEYKDYQDYLEYQKHISQPQAPQEKAQFPGQAVTEHAANAASLGYLPQIAGALDKPITGMARTMLPDVTDPKTGQPIPKEQALPDQSYIQARDKEAGKLTSLEQESPNQAFGGKIGGMIATGALLPAAGGIKGAAAVGAGLGALANPGDTQGQLSGAQIPERAANAGIGALIGGAVQGAAKGAGKLGDFLMQKATGIKKYIPGLGEKLADEGIGPGTKGMMQKQVGVQLADKGKELDQSIENIGSLIDSRNVARDIASKLQDYQTSRGTIPEAVKPEFKMIMDRVEDVARRGDVNPAEALELKRIAQRVGYKQGEPLSKLDSSLARAEAGGYNDQLEQAYERSNPGQPNRFKDINASLSALMRANQGLNAPETMASQVGKAAGKAGLGAALGYGVGGKKGALAGALATTPLAMSALGRSAIGASKIAPQLSPLAIQAILKSRQENK